MEVLTTTPVSEAPPVDPVADEEEDELSDDEAEYDYVDESFGSRVGGGGGGGGERWLQQLNGFKTQTVLIYTTLLFMHVGSNVRYTESSGGIALVVSSLPLNFA
jgi:hypothetical protein